MWKAGGGGEETSDVVQMRLVLAGFLEEVAALGFGPWGSSQSPSLGLRVNSSLVARGVCSVGESSRKKKRCLNSKMVFFPHIL